MLIRRQDRPPMRIALAIPAVLVAFALPLPESAAGAVYDLTPDPRAEHPDIAVDSAGTAHVAWNVSTGVTEDDLLVYCRVPRGGKACASTQTFTLPDNAAATHVEIAPSGAVVLVSVRCCSSPLGHAAGEPVYALISD